MLMAAHAKALTRSSKKLGIVGLGSFAVAAAFIGVGSGTANADIEEVSPTPVVTSRQASENSVIRINDYGLARGISEARVADAGVINAFGVQGAEDEQPVVRDTTKAVVGTTSSAFEGAWPVGPVLGDW
jgi:hypothetical protein